jgi:hypothetical protein
MSASEVMGKITAPAARRLAPDPDDIRAARKLHQLARVERDLGRFDRAETLAMHALKLLEHYASTSHPEVSAVLGTLVALRQHRGA